jgi:hypothetical protein
VFQIKKLVLQQVITFFTGTNGRQIFYSSYSKHGYDIMEEYKWLNVKTVELKLPNPEKAGRWPVAQIRQERRHS